MPEASSVLLKYGNQIRQEGNRQLFQRRSSQEYSEDGSDFVPPSPSGRIPQLNSEPRVFENIVPQQGMRTQAPRQPIMGSRHQQLQNATIDLNRKYADQRSQGLLGSRQAIANRNVSQRAGIGGFARNNGDVDAALAGNAPTYRAGQQFVPAGLRRLVGGPTGSVAGKMYGDHEQTQGPANSPQMTTNIRGAEVFGLPGYMTPHSTIYEGTTMPGGSQVDRGADGGLALRGNATANYKPSEEMVARQKAAAEKRQMTADTRLLNNIRLKGLSMDTPLAKAALARMGASDIQQKRDAELADMKHEHGKGLLELANKLHMESVLEEWSKLPRDERPSFLESLRTGKLPARKATGWDLLMRGKRASGASSAGVAPDGTGATGDFMM